MKATMQWKGRKLLCNGVCVAHVYKHSFAKEWHGTGGGFATKDEFDVEGPTADEARLAINRRFKLPPDFGARMDGGRG